VANAPFFGRIARDTSHQIQETRDPNLEANVRALSIGAVAFVSALLLAGCGKEEKQETTADQGTTTQQSTTTTTTTANTATTAPAASAPAATDNTTNTQAAAPAPANDQQQASAAPAAAGGKVNVYNWSDYIGEHTNENFTKATASPSNTTSSIPTRPWKRSSWPAIPATTSWFRQAASSGSRSRRACSSPLIPRSWRTSATSTRCC